ncbi:MAG: FAD-binding oxidoreductase [Thermoleophilaceae bacterium]
MTAPEPRMRWWGWGVDRDAMHLPPSAQAMIEHGLGVTERPPARVSLDQLRPPAPRLEPALRARLAEIVGDDGLRDDVLARVAHAAGRSYPDLVRLRSGEAAAGAPDAVVYPASHEQVRAVVGACSEARVAIVPFGGGTSVVGGVDPERGPFAAVISLDLARMASLVDLDEVSLTARLEAGMTGPAAEAALAAHGLTLGHLPQSWEYATIGGFAATRSAGQASTGYGRIDKLVLGLRLAAPAGDIDVAPHPGTAAGPAVRELLVGSEGTLGVITEVTLAVRPLPDVREYEGWSFRSFEAGVEAFREMEQARAAADVSRLSDPAETQMSLASAGDSGGAAAKLARRWLDLRGHGNGCLAILGFEGEADEVGDRANRARMLLRSAGGLRLGKRPGAAWLRQRYRAPYLRDELLDRGVMVETLETATTWSNLQRLHGAVAGALRESLTERGSPPVVMCHVSHLYPSGASLYFTFIAAQQRGQEIEQWRAAKTAASDAIVATGGTITHHHAIGRDHRPWMRAEVGDLGVDVLRAAKERLDPHGVMNPGKLIPD